MSVTIRVKPGTRDYLRDISVEKETYDDVINRLVIELAEAKDAVKAREAWIKACEAEG